MIPLWLFILHRSHSCDKLENISPFRTHFTLSQWNNEAATCADYVSLGDNRIRFSRTREELSVLEKIVLLLSLSTRRVGSFLRSFCDLSCDRQHAADNGNVSQGGNGRVSSFANQLTIGIIQSSLIQGRGIFKRGKI